MATGKPKPWSTVLCEDCPCWRPLKMPDGSPCFEATVNDQGQAKIDDKGRPVWRKGKDGRLVVRGRCVAKLPEVLPLIPNVQTWWPITSADESCEAPEKHAALDRAKARS